MSFMDEYRKLKKKQQEEEKEETKGESSESSFMSNYKKLKGKQTTKQDDDIAPTTLPFRPGVDNATVSTLPLLGDYAPVATTVGKKKTIDMSKGVDKAVTYTSEEDDLLNLLPAQSRATFQRTAKEAEKKKANGMKVDPGLLENSWDIFSNSLLAGLGQFNQSLTATADVILGKPLQAMGWENNPISAIADYYDKSAQYYSEKSAQAVEEGGGGKLMENISKGTQIVFGGLPHAVLALMTAGGSTVASSSTLATNAAVNGGNILTKAGITLEAIAKNPQFWLSWGSEFGNNYEEAQKELTAKREGKAAFTGEEVSETERLKDDTIATFSAMFTSLINAGIEIGIDGASGIQGLPQDVLDGGSSAVVDWVKSSLEEGGEEVLQGFVSNAVAKVAYDSDRDVANLKEMGENFIWGTAAGAALGGGQVLGVNAVNAIHQQQANKLTENEQKVVDKLVEDRIAEAEKDGEKLSKKDAEKQVRNEMEKGYISTDTIEEVLGGESYTAYKDNSDRLDALQAEYDELYKMKNGDKSDEQIDRQAELKKQLDELKQTFNRDQARTKLNDEVFDMVKGERLAESYNELARRHQSFQADLSQYDEKQQKVIQKAIDSGVLNNTNRTHEFVDMVAKISADKGVLFDFTNNQKLRESGFAMDGVVRNGFVTKDGVTLNVQAAKSLNKVVGHEITHVLEGTDFYSELQNTVFEYAKSKGEYDSRLQAITELYNKHDPDADPVKELTADLVGDYLFTDTEFINNLSTNHRNVFQKIYDEVKYLCKVATAGSKEARQLEKVKKAFEDAYRADSKAKTEKQYSLTMVDDIQPTSDKWHRGAITDEVRAEHPTLYAVDETATEKHNPTQVKGTLGSYRNVYDSLKNEGFSGTILDASSGLGYGTKAGIEEYGFNVEDIEPYPDKNYTPKYTDYSTLDKKYDVVISNAVLNVLPQDQRDALVVKMGELLNPGGRMFVNVRGKDVLNASGKIAINEANMEYFIPRTEKTGSYQKGFTKAELKAYLEDALGEGFTVEPTNLFSGVGVIVTKDSGVKYSLSDSDGKQLSNEQQEYFKDSKMRDDNGNLMVMYHGSQDAGFHVFDSSMSDDDTSFFFVDRNDVAATYSGTTETYEAKAFRTVEDANNFFAEIGKTEYEVVENDGKYTLLDDGDEVATSDDLSVLYDEFRDWEGVGYGDANYKVYLNLTNPLVVDAKGRPWNKIDAEFSQEVYDRYQSLTAEEKAALTDLAEWEDFSLFNREIQEANGNELASAYAKLGEDVNIYDLFSVAADSFSEEAMRENSRNYLKTRDYAQRAKEQGYDGVIFKNIVDNGGYSSGDEGASTVAIAFDSNQIKSVANDKPTADPDIRFSLSEDSQGRKLSENQAMYFKESKVVDENGKLKAVYHGSPTDFNTFSLKYIGANGTAEGYGFYFTDKKAIAENYTRGREGQQNGEPGKLFEVYLDIKKPLSDTEVTMSRAQFKKFLTTLNRQVDADGEPLDILSNYGDVSWEGLNKVLNYAMEIEYDGSDNDVNLVSSIITGCGNMEVVLDVLRKTTGYDGIIVNEASWGGDQTIYLAFHPEQIKNVDNLNPTTDPDIRKSLSNVGETDTSTGNYNVYGKDIALPSALEDVAPVSKAETATETAKTEQNVPISEDVAKNATTTEELFPDNLSPIDQELDTLNQKIKGLEDKLYRMAENGDVGEEFNRLSDEWSAVKQRITALQQEANTADADRLASLDDADVPPEMEAPYQGTPSEPMEAPDPFADRDMNEVGNRKVKAYQYENPEVKPYFREAALGMLGDLHNGTKGEKWYNDELYYESGGEKGWGGTKRTTTADIADLLDNWHYTYDQIEKGLNAIIEDNGAENNAVSKRIEFMLDDRLRNGYTGVDGRPYPPNQGYINLLKEKQIMEYSEEARQSFWANADKYAPPVDDDYAPVVNNPATEEVLSDTPKGVVGGQHTLFTTDHITGQNQQPVASDAHPVAEVYTSKSGEAKGQQAMYKDAIKNQSEKTAKRVTKDQVQPKKKLSAWSWAKEHIFSHGAVFEDLSLETDNRELQARFDMIRRAESRAQNLIGKGIESKNIKALLDIKRAVDNSGKSEAFHYYMYHLLNTDRMTLEDRFKDTPNKAVFGDTMTAERSAKSAANLLKMNPEFKQYGQQVYDILKYCREMMVEDGGLISQETADLLEKMYPHYVPIRRVGHDGANVNVPLDTNKTGVNTPIKRATGGNGDMYDIFDAVAEYIEQVHRAVAKNRFGVELKNTLGTTIEKTTTNIDEVLDNVEKHEELLQEGKDGQYPTFTVFENGERVKFEITDEMYEAMKPSQFTYTNKVANAIGNARRDITTTYSPTFMATNPIKDIQDVLLNSQHPLQTYLHFPQAIKEITTKGKYYQERMEYGGDQDSYFDSQTKTFKKERGKVGKIFGFPIDKLKQANEAFEQVPRLAEYIASRKMGRSIDVSMLDAGRVTTNFGAPGDFTNMLNRNGFTFLSASVEGFNQQVRNVREAKAEGAKGWLKLAAKYTLAGLPAVLLNSMLWGDDDDYEELSDYVKDNYYIVWKYGDGQFVRIPKGRAVSVIQNAFEQTKNAVTGDNEVDFWRFADLFFTNLAPNDPLDNNIISPIVQVANNRTWYGDDLVPTRLEDLPDAEQYDESTDMLSRWIGEVSAELGFDISPVKVNYLLDQYSGGVGDIALPYFTPEADGGGFGAAFRDKFTTDSTLKNKNVSNFYSKVNELTTNAKSSKATDEDTLRYKYINSVNTELSELYKQKREIQNSDLSDDEKYAEVRAIQQQIVDIARDALANCETVNIDGKYASVGDREYRWYEPSEDSSAEPGWQKISADQLAKQNEVTKGLGITPGEYWDNKAEYDMKYYHPDKYKVLQEQGISVSEYKEKYEESAFIYTDDYSWAESNPEKYTLSKAITDDVATYKRYTSEIADIEGDKDENGKTISGSKKEKVKSYIFSLDNLDYGQQIILYKSMYDSAEDRANYNADIVEYLNSRDDISYEEMNTILKELGFTIEADGVTVTWD